MPFDELVDFIDRLQRAVKGKRFKANIEEREGSKKRKSSETNDIIQKPKFQKNKQQKKYCANCKKNNHYTSDCWFPKNNNSSKPTYNGINKKNPSTMNKKEQMFTVEQMSALLAHLPSHIAAKNMPPRKKRRILMDSDDEEFNTGDCESPSVYFAHDNRSSTK